MLRELGKELLTQDNRATKDPVFLVQQRRRIYGLDSEYAEKFTWVGEDDYKEADPDTAARLEREFSEADYPDESFEGYIRVGYQDIWETETVFFTLKGAEEYMKNQRHNLKHPRIYVESAHRNPEWKMLRKFFMNLAEQPEFRIDVPKPDLAPDGNLTNCPECPFSAAGCRQTGNACPEPGTYLFVREQ